MRWWLQEMKWVSGRVELDHCAVVVRVKKITGGGVSACVAHESQYLLTLFLSSIASGKWISIT